jgi:outer membrane protein TolC
MRALIAVFLLMLAAGSAPLFCAQPESNGLEGVAAVLQAHSHMDMSGPAMTLDEIERIALAVNPEIELAARRVAVAQAHVPTVGSLDDPMAMVREWQVPLRKPWDLNAAQEMFSLSQTFVARSKRTLRTSEAESDVTEAKTQLEQVRLEVRVRVHKSFYDLLRVEDELRIHDQHLGLGQQAIEAAQIKYAVGKVPQQDMLKAQVTLTRLTEHMIMVEQDGELAKARLNTLLARDPATPLNVEGKHPVTEALPAMQTLEDLAVQARSDLAMARAAADRSHKEQALAKKAYIPDLTVAGGYMLMPTGSEMRNNYMVEGTINLPWLNKRKHDADIAEATVRITEQDAELAALRNAAFGQIQEALVETRYSQKLVEMYDEQLRPQAEATLQSSVIAYENGKTELLDLLDSQMALIEIDLARLQATADFDTHLADLELATGASLTQLNVTAAEVKQ